MAAPKPQDIIIMGFAAAMFGFGSDAELELVIRDLITEQQALVDAHLTTPFASLSGSSAVRAGRAIKLLTAADLCRMRINRLAQEVKLEDGSDAAKMRTQIREYTSAATDLIASVNNELGATNGFAVGNVVTSNNLGGMS